MASTFDWEQINLRKLYRVSRG